MSTGDVSLVGVYDADGTFAGEVWYWLGARLGRVHCSLCEITHGLFREKPEWRECRDSLNVEFATFHRDDAPQDVLDACGHQLPAVVARSVDGVVVILGPGDLEALGGDVPRFHVALSAACNAQGIALD